ncbi:hypothetical protein MNBD_GAMMA22-142 [hydrothermal vent metagenome]|uniref:PEGA domain-containing protein n=1 Tax=hydrothermal vent metagenome TaxID=652676 RepID=A0A3B1A7R3_9ZZZZ
MLTATLFKKIKVSTYIAYTLLFITACSHSTGAIKTFSDKKLPSSQYAKLEAPTGTLILEIDGKELAYAPQYHILPGKHTLHVMVSAFKGEQAYKVGDIDISFMATAEHLYHVKSLATLNQGNSELNKKRDEYLWIEDVTLDTVVAGKKP